MAGRESSPNGVSGGGLDERLRKAPPEVVCWLRLRVWSLALGAVVNQGAARALRQALARQRTNSSAGRRSRGGFGLGLDWAAALELTIATNGAEPYKSRLKELFPQMITPEQMDLHGWTAVRALPYLDASAKDQMREAVKTYMAGLDRRLDATPFGVPPSLGTWGGSGAVVDMAIRMYFLHKAFPDLVGPEYTLRAVNYILGTHPVSSTSYVAGVGTVSKTMTYSNNRADNAYIPGAVIPGYIIIKPDFPECIDDFGFLWFEDEAVVAGSASWVVAGNAADAIIKESK